MPVFGAGPGEAPPWSELRDFTVQEIKAGETMALGGECQVKVVVSIGSARIDIAGRFETLGPGGVFERSAGLTTSLVAESDAEVVVLRGSWSNETGGTGIFEVREVADAVNRGDEADYERNTSFDRHFHDCDEFWIILEGSGLVVTEGREYRVARGDCVATGMGHHHDFPHVDSPVRAVYAETSLQGAKRHGHLWEHTHGPASPRLERV